MATRDPIAKDPQHNSFFRRLGPTRLMYYLGKTVPAPLAGMVVRAITEMLLAVKPSNYYGALDNLSHVYAAIRHAPDQPPSLRPAGGEPVRRRGVEEEVLQSARRLFYYSTLSYYHLFRNLGRGIKPEAYQPRVELAPGVEGYLNAAASTGRGLFVLGSHMSAFDLCGIAFAEWAPAPVQALSLADPPAGFEFVNRLRSKGRGTITPISPETLREAMQRLRSGGVVLTGVDRPTPNGNERVTFFGQPAYLPTGYIRIPLKTDCLVMTMAFRYVGGHYEILANPPMEMVRTGDREHDARVNVQRVLSQIEGFVRMAPDQWMVFTPVWPDVATVEEGGCRN